MAYPKLKNGKRIEFLARSPTDTPLPIDIHVNTIARFEPEILHKDTDRPNSIGFSILGIEPLKMENYHTPYTILTCLPTGKQIVVLHTYDEVQHVIQSAVWAG